MTGLKSKLSFFVWLVLVAGLLLLCYVADAKPAVAESDGATTETAEQIHKMVRLKAYVMDWSAENFFDVGFSLLYQKALDSGAVIDMLDLTFPLQNQTDLGLKLFFENLNVNDGLVEASLEMLERSGKLHVLAEPEITLKAPEEIVTDSGKSLQKDSSLAKVHSGTSVPYGTFTTAGDTLAQITQFKETGVILIIRVKEVTPEGYVKFRFNATVKDLTGFVSVSTDQDGHPLEAPQTADRMIETTVMARDGQPLVVGILKNTSKSKTRVGIPLLSDIPILGALFGSNSYKLQVRELVFVVVPRIIEQRVK